MDRGLLYPQSNIPSKNEIVDLFSLKGSIGSAKLFKLNIEPYSPQVLRGRYHENNRNSTTR